METSGEDMALMRATRRFSPTCPKMVRGRERATCAVFNYATARKRMRRVRWAL